MPTLDPALTVTLDGELATRLRQAAERAGLGADDLVVRCVRAHLDDVSAYARVQEELAAIRMNLVELAGLVGEAVAEPGPGLDAASLCRYPGAGRRRP